MESKRPTFTQIFESFFGAYPRPEKVEPDISHMVRIMCRMILNLGYTPLQVEQCFKDILDGAYGVEELLSVIFLPQEPAAVITIINESLPLYREALRQALKRVEIK